MKTQHDGDCTIYASLMGEWPSNGICTCGYAHEQKREVNPNYMEIAFSKAKLEELNDCRNKKTH